MIQRTASSPAELLAALEAGHRDIRIIGVMQGMPSIRLPAGAKLTGGKLIFGARGIVLSSDNQLEDIEIDCPAHEVAIGNTSAVDDTGILALNGVRTKGQVLIVAEGFVLRGTVLIDDLHIAAADLRGREQRPHGYGVDVLQGALTVWNRHESSNSVIEVEAREVSAGTLDRPIRGSGVFVGGRCDDTGHPTGGTVTVRTLHTGAVVTDGGIPEGTPDLISGGVFVQAGATADMVVNSGPTTTLGPNDMALDNWGRVKHWTCLAPVTTRGPSGIGFVNFGDLDELDVQAQIETFATGARGFNLYDGTLNKATFDSIATHGDGSVGIQVAKPLPTLGIRHHVTTAGGSGTSLVRGQQVQLQAIAISVKEGGRIETLTVGGDIKTSGEKVVSLEVLGTIEHLDVGGQVVADGEGSNAAHVTRAGAAVLDGVDLVALRGRALVVVDQAS